MLRSLTNCYSEDSVHDPFVPLTKEQVRAFDRCGEQLLSSTFQSYEHMAMEVYAKTGQTIATQTYRRWFRQHDVPTRVAITLAEIAEDPSVLGKLCPFLSPYLKEGS